MTDPNRETPEARKARNGRNIAMALGLGVLVILIFVISLVRMGANAGPHF